MWLGIMPINTMYHESLDGNNIGGTVGKNGEPVCKIHTKSRKEKSLTTKVEGFDIVNLLPINLIFPRNDAILKVQCRSLFLVCWDSAMPLTRSPLLRRSLLVSVCLSFFPAVMAMLFMGSLHNHCCGQGEKQEDVYKVSCPSHFQE